MRGCYMPEESEHMKYYFQENKEDIMKKKLAWVMTLVLVVLACSGLLAAASAESTELTKIRAAFHPNLGPMTIPGIEKKMGFFKEEGLDVEWLKFTAGAPEIAAMVSGDLQFGYIGHGALALCAEGQAEVLSLSHFTNSEALLVRADSGIKTMADLVGKTVATEAGTSGEVLLEMACTKYGVPMDSLNFVNMSITNAVAAFVGGSIDAVVAWGADITSIMDNVDEEVFAVVQTSDFMDVVPFIGSWIANGDYVKENPDMALRFLRGLNKCYDYRYEHLDETIQAAADFAEAQDIGVTYDNLNSERDQLVFFPLSDAEEWLTNGKMEGDFQLQLEYMINSGRIEKGDIQDYVRFDLMKEALGI